MSSHKKAQTARDGYEILALFVLSLEHLLCGSRRIFAPSAFEFAVNAEDTEVRRGR